MNETKAIFMFSEDENVKDINLEVLSQSLMIRDAKGQPPKNRPIQSWELIEMIHTMCKDANLNAEVKHIYVPRSSSNPIINREEKELYINGDNIPIDKWLFNRVAFMVQIHHEKDVDMVTAIVGSFHDKGVQIAFGQHVNICSNMCIFGENTMYTFGEEKMPFEKMTEILEKWIAEFEVKRATDIEIIEQMKSYVIEERDVQGMVDAMVGRLYRNAVKTVYLQGGSQVFNITQCSAFVQELETKLKARNEYEETNPNVQPELTLWDIYNWGTAILSPETTDLLTVYKTVCEWGTFLSDFASFNLRATTEFARDRAVASEMISNQNFFRTPTDDEAEEFRQWARNNYVPNEPISEVWHPVVRQECEQMNLEATVARQENPEGNIPPSAEEDK